MKDILFNKEAFDKLLVGLNKTADTIIGTLGPKGRNVFIDDPMLPHITNDGYTIANSISFEDRYENLGAWVVKNTSSKTNDDVGDGTTTTAVLLQSIINESLARPENPMYIRNELQESVKRIVKEIKKQSKPITLNDIYQVALISSEDKEIAKIVSDVIKKIGKEGVVVVEESKTFETSSEVIEGYEANFGFMSPYLANDVTNTKAIYEHIPVVCTKKKIQTVMDIKPLFDQLNEKKISQIVIVCEDIDPQILGILVMNKVQGKLNILVIRATGDVLVDIAATTGASIISDETGLTFDQFNINEHCGTSDKVICTSKTSLFIGKTNSGKIHAELLSQQLNNITNQYEKEIIKKRIAKLTGGIAIIKIGSTTDLDRVYKKHKTDDTVASVKSALEEGVVEGGGMCFWRIAQNIKVKTVGDIILKKALTTPLKKICENAGLDYSEIISNMPIECGYNAKTGCYDRLLDVGVIDSAKVERVALENAVSNSSNFITMHATIVDIQSKK